MKKVILHLCADLGSDSWFYQQNKEEYNVILIGKDYGVENLTEESLNKDFNVSVNEVYGIIANPVCTLLSTARKGGKAKDLEGGMFLVNHCIRVIEMCNPKFWVIENPATGELKKKIGEPDMVYQPWEYGSPWTKKTGLWGVFNHPTKVYHAWKDVPKIEGLYIRHRNKGEDKPNLPFLHKSAVYLIPEFEPFIPFVKCDADLRSLCSQKFAKAFYEVNR